VFTPLGMLRTVIQIPGNRHDVQGLYALLKTSFHGLLLGDNAYSARPSKARELEAAGIKALAAKRTNTQQPHPKAIRALLREWRRRVERRISMFDAQFAAARTLCRSDWHHIARRWMKVTAHNMSRLLNIHSNLKRESVAHFRLAA
jgi:hypothetical protein